MVNKKLLICLVAMFFCGGAFAANRPAGFKTICMEGNNCAVQSLTNVAFGRDNQFRFKYISGNFICSKATFGGRVKGGVNECSISAIKTSSSLAKSSSSLVQASSSATSSSFAANSSHVASSRYSANNSSVGRLMSSVSSLNVMSSLSYSSPTPSSRAASSECGFKTQTLLTPVNVELVKDNQYYVALSLNNAIFSNRAIDVSSPNTTSLILQRNQSRVVFQSNALASILNEMLTANFSYSVINSVDSAMVSVEVYGSLSSALAAENVLSSVSSALRANTKQYTLTLPMGFSMPENFGIFITVESSNVIFNPRAILNWQSMTTFPTMYDAPEGLMFRSGTTYVASGKDEFLNLSFNYSIPDPVSAASIHVGMYDSLGATYDITKALNYTSVLLPSDSSCPVN